MRFMIHLEMDQVQPSSLHDMPSAASFNKRSFMFFLLGLKKLTHSKWRQTWANRYSLRFCCNIQAERSRDVLSKSVSTCCWPKVMYETAAATMVHGDGRPLER
jgi:hypothetical protein